jgi:alpha 1,3-glucosidase
MLQHQSTFKGLLLRSQNEDRPFILSRSFFAGTQKYGAIWTGDNAADWEHLKQTIPMLLTISISGLPFAGADVGGFFGDPDVELLTRWYQMAAYQPFFRAHAHIETKRREPFLYPENDMVLMRKSVEERYRLLPFFYTLFQESTRGNPVMRSMMQNFPYDERTFDMDDQFMVGDVLVMKPITESGQKSVQVYLPQTVIYN